MKLLLWLISGLLVASVFAEGTEDSCAGRCNQRPDSSKSCQCNRPCLRFGDCCSDYVDMCLQPRPTCENRCGEPYDPSHPCQCTADCSSRHNCCPDYVRLCGSHHDKPDIEDGVCTKISVTNEDISEVSLELWRLDDNRAGPEDIVVKPQSVTEDGANVDLSHEPFFAYVNEDVLQRPTFQSLISLLDNYDRHQGQHESFTDEEFAEVNRFLDLFLSTRVGQRLYRFLDSKGLAGCGDLDTFKDQLYKIWFQMYSRMHGATDSSGFEHVFVGEIKKRKVSGFHNWVQLYLLEKQGKLDYYGFVRRSEPEIYGANFNWDGYVKPLGGVMVGSSPELEFALITLCHLTRPGSKCYVTLENRSGTLVNVPIQTWTWSRDSPGNGLKYLSSGYFVT